MDETNGVIEQTVVGYPVAGTRNVVACIGNGYVKIAVTGCTNDCVKEHIQDTGIIGQVELSMTKTVVLGVKPM